MILLASLILVFCGLIHSVLGEKYILIRLFKRDNLPHLYGSDVFTKGTLRFAWHVTSFAWFGFAALLVSYSPESTSHLLNVVAVVFLVSSICSAYFTKGKHFSWVLFMLVSILCYLSV
ncbi:hypothetical protein PULV_a3119 [Pseudoalteromonas ulvae UL12]|uniref:DUF3325 domain-containing protein n=1 Tax=Pseudoalteromonas ulvae TaxID=107327 RepID=A0A244CWE2_PSEDV|nr:hypothetical protein [Pseudoalteromonas ulvae]MBE0362477.1 hypothetical protein [Pseudoalteromonas ulvae UL12]OUL59559.1 hypothetical protein B1199_04695 [Pseudoalteromonas ulvae]